MPGLSGTDRRKFVKYLESKGCKLSHVLGSHYYYDHPSFNDIEFIVIPHNKVCSPGVIQSALKRLNIERKVFEKEFYHKKFK
jgi:predicted RNA binding protein YcfA (HicA-like mRNA interferase family)